MSERDKLTLCKLVDVDCKMGGFLVCWVTPRANSWDRKTLVVNVGNELAREIYRMVP